jgi:short-subunit dehydrogenase
MSYLQRATQAWSLQRSLTGGTAELPWSSPRPVDGLTVAITGASSGIGASATRRLARRGAHVLAIARDGDRLARVAAEVGGAPGTVEPLPADLTSEADAGRVIDVLNARAIDVLVNNAGRSIRRPIAESTGRFHDFQRTMDINYFAAVRLTLGVLDMMISRGSGQFVNVCTWALLPRTMPKFAAYGASKAALEIFGRSLAAELGPSSGITTTTLYYPLVRTEMIAPTAKYDNAVALTQSQAAEWIEHAIRHRPVKVQPNLMKGAPLGDMTFPQIMDRITRRGA